MYKNIVEGKKAAFFDLDGTIAQTEAFWLKALEDVFMSQGKEEIGPEARSVLTSFGSSIKSKWQSLIQKGLIKTKLSVEELSDNTYSGFLKLIDEYEIEITEGFWDIVYELKANRNFKLALTTNTSKNIAEKILNKLQIKDTFDFMIFGDEVKNPKPSPEIYIKALETLGVQKKETIVFEDSPPGIEAAITAELETVVIWNGFTQKSQYPKSPRVLWYIADFTALVPNLDHTYDEAWQEYSKKAMDKFEKRLQDRKAQSTNSNATSFN